MQKPVMSKKILIEMLLENILTDKMNKLKIRTKTKEMGKKGKEMIIKVIALKDSLVTNLIIDLNHQIDIET